jgi:hypothetical protein
LPSVLNYQPQRLVASFSVLEVVVTAIVFECLPLRIPHHLRTFLVHSFLRLVSAAYVRILPVLSYTFRVAMVVSIGGSEEILEFVARRKRKVKNHHVSRLVDILSRKARELKAIVSFVSCRAVPCRAV